MIYTWIHLTTDIYMFISMGIAIDISMDILVPVEYNILFIPLQDSVYVFTYTPRIIFSKYWIQELSRTI